jgi:hypothetical protein
MLNSAIVEAQGRLIVLPEKFLPSEEFLSWHNENIFGRI